CISKWTGHHPKANGNARTTTPVPSLLPHNPLGHSGGDAISPSVSLHTRETHTRTHTHTHPHTHISIYTKSFRTPKCFQFFGNHTVLKSANEIRRASWR